MSDLAAFIFLLSIVIFIVGLVKPALFSKIGIGSRKKAAILAISLFILSIIIAPKNTTTSTNQKVIPTITATKIPSKIPTKAIQKFSDEYQSKILGIIALMQDANDDVINAGNAGQKYDFDMAKVYISLAESKFTSTEREIQNLPDSNDHRVKEYLLLAMAKMKNGTQLMSQGIDQINADLIIEGSEVYAEGNDYIKKATLELQK